MRQDRFEVFALGAIASALIIRFFVSANSIFISSQSSTLPNSVIQIQDTRCFLLKFRVSRKYPTAILPGFYGVIIEPSPDGRGANLGTIPRQIGSAANFVATKSRQWEHDFHMAIRKQGL